MPSESSRPRPLVLEPLIHPKEKIYFAICVVVSLVVYIGLAMAILSGGQIAGTLITYLIFGIIAFFVVHGLHIGHVRGNGVRVSSRQFPELNAMADLHARRLGLDETPAIFVLQSGGVLNAFATRFLGRNFVILNSDVLALATQKGEKAVSFVLGHELGHVQRKHMTRRALLYPAMVFPFLSGAYSRAASTRAIASATHSSPKAEWMACWSWRRDATSTPRSTRPNTAVNVRRRQASS
jgi:Zn-dependent protease with chaperone function